MLNNIIGIKLKKEGRIYNFNATDLVLHKGEQALVDTENGVALGVAVTDVSRLPSSEIPPQMRKVIRKATADDMCVRAELESLERDARKFCAEKIAERGLSMKLITVECFFDKSKMIFYFTAEARVDFRELVKDLVSRFKTRIELKQISARQEARIIKGIAVCGREVCCAGILQNLDRVTVKMAKEQGMSLNPEKISGLCGRLMCCLSFEHTGYAGAKKIIREAAVKPEAVQTAPEESPGPSRRKQKIQPSREAKKKQNDS